MKTKNKIKTVSPTQRGKKRYLLFRLLASGSLSRKEIENALWDNYLSLFASLGCASMKLWLVNWSEAKNTGIIRYSLEGDNNVRAGLLFLREVNGKQVIPKIIKVSGTINKLKGN